MDGRCIFSSIDLKTMEFYKVVPKDLDGIVSLLRITKGVECAIFLYQTKTLEYKVSLRSNGKVDVAAIASYFGGGVHVRAAGCTMQGTVHDCVNNLSEQIEKQLNKKLDVIKVKTLSQEQCYTRELMLLKVKYNKNNRRDIIEICDNMKTEIVDMSKHFMMLQICDAPEKIDTLIKMLQTISIVEVARTGTLALSKCTENDD